MVLILLTGAALAIGIGPALRAACLARQYPCDFDGAVYADPIQAKITDDFAWVLSHSFGGSDERPTAGCAAGRRHASAPFVRASRNAEDGSHEPARPLFRSA